MFSMRQLQLLLTEAKSKYKQHVRAASTEIDVEDLKVLLLMHLVTEPRLELQLAL